eukprot:RCo001095
MTEYRPLPVGTRYFPMLFNVRHWGTMPVLYGNREDVFLNPILKVDGKPQLVAKSYPNGEFMRQVTAPSNPLSKVLRRATLLAFAAAGLYLHLDIADGAVSHLVFAQSYSPYKLMTLREKFIYTFVPNKNKPSRSDMLKLLIEARREVPKQGVDFWTYRLKSGRVPKVLFVEPPPSYRPENRVENFRDYLWSYVKPYLSN